MIKVVLTDADTPLGGEILRLLIHHPDVEITGLVAPRYAGQSATSVHHGLIGEPLMRFRNDAPAEADVIFYCGTTTPSQNVRTAASQNKLKIIDLSSTSYRSDALHGAVPAISEIFRKPLVRGAVEARILSPLESVLVIALFPLARNLMLSTDLNVDVEISESVIADLDSEKAACYASRILHNIQQSFNSPVHFNIKSREGDDRGLRIRTTIDLAMQVSDIMPLYDNLYDDHNFTFLTSVPCSTKEVIGTNKCIIYLNREGADKLIVEAVADARMRGWAGEAVLAMNLMFGLYERTGLELKPSIY